VQIPGSCRAPVLIAVISDTHLPRGRRRIPDACVDWLRRADLIVHAGDLTTLAVLEELRGYGATVAVRGNVDDAAVCAGLPSSAEIELDGAHVAVVHDAGPRAGRLARMRTAFPGADAVIFGHSHIPLHETAPDGFQIFNPGSPTDKRRAPQHTMGLARVRQGRIAFRLIEL
jgi:putative phosphoesterase